MIHNKNSIHLFTRFLPFMLIFIVTACHLNKQENEPKKPNIIVILCDDLDFDELNFYNTDTLPCYNGASKHGVESAQVETLTKPPYYMPHIDKLAKKGAIFTRFYANSSVCTPVRYALLTGRHSYKSPFLVKESQEDSIAFIKWNTYISPNEYTVVNAMHKRGYKAGIIGKWHNGLNGRPIYFPHNKDDILDSANSLKIKADYKLLISFLQDSLGFDFAGRIHYDNPFILNLEWITEGTIEFINKYKKNPFYLYIALPLPHAQYYDYKEWDPLATPAGMLNKNPNSKHNLNEAREKNREKTGNEHYSMATWIDDFIGVLMKTLKETGLDKNTMIIFTSDQQTRGKFTCYETNRIPFILYYPPLVKKGIVIGDLCQINDLVPTILELIDGKQSQEDWYDGVSFLPLFLHDNNRIYTRDYLYLEIGYSKAIVTKEYKYIANRPPQKILDIMNNNEQESIRSGKKRQIGWDGYDWHWDGVVYHNHRDFPCYFDKDQLYDLRKDVFEQHNLSYNSLYAPVLFTMKNLLKKEMVAYPYKFGEFAP